MGKVKVKAKGKPKGKSKPIYRPKVKLVAHIKKDSNGNPRRKGF